MALLSSSLLIAATASLSAMLGEKSVHTEIDIPATPDQVWEVLVTTEQYNKWNQVLVPIEGKLIEGSSVKYQFHQDEDNISEIPAKVKKIVPYQLINQTGGMYGILTFDHKYILEPSEAGTRVVIHEDYTGIGVHFWDTQPVQHAYEKLILSLKNRVIELN